MSNRKVMIIHLIAGLIKNIQYNIVRVLKTRFYLTKMSQYFPKPYEPFGGDINFKVDL